ncbi:DUF1993 domain-containing protein [Sphingomonas sp. HHU CXW]|uniref:DUF1993 domain-containing protein n=1 Tax=Sphingomonas hominis TaxID=2741495 RepID=A0ABX2JJS1_9SPHN|nr:DUF1993 domain-containing protein [Sphingomonas hominis]NTS64697.1 DUF1993 domain-containing protein [Sphingomonas hominis]
MTLSDLLLPTYTQMLGTMATWLDKAEAARGDEAEALLSARLAPDMFPLATQVRFACRQAQEAVFRLQARDFSPAIQQLLEEARNAGERPGTLADARARINETLAVVEAAATDGLTLEGDAPVAHALPNGMVMNVTATVYARDWALPQFYFHVVTAYAILRAQSVELGKADYCAHMLPYFSMPQSG